MVTKNAVNVPMAMFVFAQYLGPCRVRFILAQAHHPLDDGADPMGPAGIEEPSDDPRVIRHEFLWNVRNLEFRNIHTAQV